MINVQLKFENGNCFGAIVFANVTIMRQREYMTNKMNMGLKLTPIYKKLFCPFEVYDKLFWCSELRPLLVL